MELTRYPDFAGDDNRGFLADRLELVADGRPAGYLVMSHMPFHRLLNWYGDEAARLTLGYHAKLRCMDVDKLLASGENMGNDPLVDGMTMDDVWQDLDCKGIMPSGVSINYHVDRPYIDYIRTYRQGDHLRPSIYYRFNQQKHEPKIILEGFPPMGLGKLLYVEGARWMAERGMLLHASQTQAKEAVWVWESLQRTFPQAVRSIRSLRWSNPGKDAWRTVLDGSLLPHEWLPSCASSIERRDMPSGMHEASNNMHDLDERMATMFREDDQLAREGGHEPMGGEAYPASPAEALAIHERLAPQVPRT